MPQITAGAQCNLALVCVQGGSPSTEVPVRTFCRHIVLGAQLMKAVLLNQSWH